MWAILLCCIVASLHVGLFVVLYSTDYSCTVTAYQATGYCTPLGTTLYGTRTVPVDSRVYGILDTVDL